MTFDPNLDPQPPKIFDDLAAEHGVPELLARRLRSETCLSGGSGCTDPMCLCTCHEPDFPAAPPEGYLARIVMGLDRIISQTPGSWDGFSVPPPFYPVRP